MPAQKSLTLHCCSQMATWTTYREAREQNANETLAPCAGLVLHGLRATAVVRLRRAGATTPQIVDMVGLSAPMVERYSRFADQKQNTLAAVVLLDRKANRTGQESQIGALT